MKRKAKKANARKERHLTPAELKKISAGLAAATRLAGTYAQGEFDQLAGRWYIPPKL